MVRTSQVATQLFTVKDSSPLYSLLPPTLLRGLRSSGPSRLVPTLSLSPVPIDSGPSAEFRVHWGLRERGPRVCSGPPRSHRSPSTTVQTELRRYSGKRNRVPESGLHVSDPLLHEVRSALLRWTEVPRRFLTNETSLLRKRSCFPRRNYSCRLSEDRCQTRQPTPSPQTSQTLTHPLF